MSFNTNKYTRPVLLKSLKSINARQYSSFNSFVSAFSPRAGAKSAKVNALATVLGTNTSGLRTLFANSSTNGKTVKGILLNSVKYL